MVMYCISKRERERMSERERERKRGKDLLSDGVW